MTKIKFLCFSIIFLFNINTAQADFFLATHLLLNTLAVKYLPSYESTTAHGAFITGNHGYRYELGDSFKTGSDTEGSEKSSPGIGAGYQFLNSTSHKFSIVYQRKFAKYQTINEVEGSDTIDSFGFRFNWGLLAFKFGWSNHAFDDDTDNKHDGGSYSGIGFDLYYKRISFYMDLTDHYLEDRKIHIAGGDIGFRYHFGSMLGN